MSNKKVVKFRKPVTEKDLKKWKRINNFLYTVLIVLAIVIIVYLVFWR